MMVFYFMESKKSTFKGITWREDKQKWIVRTTVNGSRIYGGCHSTLLEAEKRLKEINPKLFSNKIKRNDLIRKKEIKKAKEYIKLKGIRGIKYVFKTDEFEVYVKLKGNKTFIGSYYDPNEAFAKYHQWKDAQNYWYNKEKRRRGIKWFNEEWIAFVYIKGKYKELGKFKHYLDALEAVAEEERDNPDCDLI